MNRDKTDQGKKVRRKRKDHTVPFPGGEWGKASEFGKNSGFHSDDTEINSHANNNSKREKL